MLNCWCITWPVGFKRLNPFCHLLALVGAHHIFHVRRIRDKCEQHSTKQHIISLNSMVNTWPVIGSWFSFSATSVTCEILSLQPTILFLPQKDFRHGSIQEITFTEIMMLREAFQELCHVSHTPKPNLPSLFINSLSHYRQNQHMAAQSVQWLGYMLEDLGFKSWQKQENYLFSKTSRPAAATNQPPPQWNLSFFSGSKVAGADNLTTHICLKPNLKNSRAILHSTCLPPWHILELIFLP